MLAELINQKYEQNRQVWQDYNTWLDEEHREIGIKSFLDYLESELKVVVYAFYSESKWGVVVDVAGLPDRRKDRVIISRNIIDRKTAEVEGIRYTMQNILNYKP